MKRVVRARLDLVLVVGLACGTLAGCASSGGSTVSGNVPGAATSEMAVRVFLDAANQEDYARMMDVFGTESGPAVEEFGVADVEARMIFLSRLLRHGSYTLTQANLAMLGPDRVRYEARMTRTRKGDVVVPVVTVPDGAGRWFVERLNVDALTAGI